MFLGSRKDENRIRRRLLQSFQKGIERRSRQHMHLVDDIDAVSADLRRNSHLIGQVADIVHRVVGGGIKFVDIEAASLVECTTRLTLIAGLGAIGILAVDSLGKDTRTSGLTHTSRATKQIGTRQLSALNGIFERRCDTALSHHRRKCLWAVLTGRNNEIIHIRQKVFK